jgi:hypothetical protein
MNIKIRPLATTGGWVPAIRDLGFKVMSRPGSFGIQHHLLKRGKVSTSFSQAPDRILFAAVSDGPTLVAMEKVGIIAA